MRANLRTRIRDLGQIGGFLCNGLMLAVLGMCGLYLIIGATPYFNNETLLLCALLFLIMSLAVVLANKPLHAPVILLIVLLASSCVPGAFALLLSPEAVATPLPLKNVGLVNAGLENLCFVLFIFFACFLGVAHFSCREAVFDDSSSNRPISLVMGSVSCGALGLLCVVFGAALLSRLPFSLGVTLYYEAPDLPIWRNILLQLIVLAIDIDSIALLTLVLISRMDMVSKMRWTAIAAVVLIYLAATISGGARSGLFRLVIYAVIVILVLDVRIKAGWSKIFLGGLLIVISAMLVFLIGTQVRHKLASAEYANGKWKQVPSEHVAFEEFRSEELPAEDVGRDLLTLGAEISSRLGSTFFYAIQSTTHEPREMARQHYFTLEYAAKNLVNNLPGTVYPDATITTSRLFGVIYRGQTEEQVQRHGYFSEFYTISGLTYLFFGRTGGLLAVAFTGFVLGLIFIKVYKLKEQRPVLHLWALFALPGGVIFTQGLDHTLWLLFISAIRFQISYKLLQWSLWLSQSNSVKNIAGISRRFGKD